MPDISGFGRGLLKGALSATEKAAEKVKDAAEAASRKMEHDDDAEATQVVSNAAVQAVDEADPDATQVVSSSITGTAPDGPPAPVGAPGPAAGSSAQFADPAGEPALADEPEDHADEADVREFVDVLQELIAKRRPPEGPIQDEWSIGVGDLLGMHPKVPKRVRGLVSRLNRFGGLSYSPHEIVFDGEDVPWEKVTELRTRNLVDYLVGDAVQQQVESLPLPWFPGRKRVLDALGQAILTVTIATAKDQIEQVELDVRVPAEIEYKASFGRKKELNAGVLSALVLVDPAVQASVLATARARGVPVTDSGEDMLADATERARKIREKVAALEAELDKFRKRFGRSG